MHRSSTITLFAPALGLLLISCAGGPPRTRPVFFPTPIEKARIQFLTHFSGSADVVEKEGAFARAVFGKEKKVDEVAKPYGVAIYEGVIYVCDTKRSLVNLFDLEGKRFGYLGVRGRGKLFKPINITIDEEGDKFVADAGRKEVVVFDADDSYVGSFGGDRLRRPVDVAVYGDKIFVCDSKACRIAVFDRKSFAFLYDFGGKGTAPGKFAIPSNIAVDKDGYLYVSDTINGRIQKLDQKGRSLSSFGRLGDMPGEFARPKGLAVDREGRIYVVDAAFENVQIFNREGRLLLNFGEAGNKPGQLNLPAQVCIDYDNVKYFNRYSHRRFVVEYLVLVTSQYGPRKVNVFGFGHYAR